MHFDKTYLLLMIVKECLGHPKLQGIADMAMAELVKINEDIKPKREPMPTPEPEPKIVPEDPPAQVDEPVERRI